MSHTVRASVLLPDLSSGLRRGSMACTPAVLVDAGKGCGSGGRVASPSEVCRGTWASCAGSGSVPRGIGEVAPAAAKAGVQRQQVEAIQLNPKGTRSLLV